MDPHCNVTSATDEVKDQRLSRSGDGVSELHSATVIYVDKNGQISSSAAAAGGRGSRAALQATDRYENRANSMDSLSRSAADRSVAISSRPHRHSHDESVLRGNRLPSDQLTSDLDTLHEGGTEGPEGGEFRRGREQPVRLSHETLLREGGRDGAAKELCKAVTTSRLQTTASSSSAETRSYVRSQTTSSLRGAMTQASYSTQVYTSAGARHREPGSRGRVNSDADRKTTVSLESSDDPGYGRSFAVKLHNSESTEAVHHLQPRKGSVAEILRRFESMDSVDSNGSVGNAASAADHQNQTLRSEGLYSRSQDNVSDSAEYRYVRRRKLNEARRSFLLDNTAASGNTREPRRLGQHHHSTSPAQPPEGATGSKSQAERFLDSVPLDTLSALVRISLPTYVIYRLVSVNSVTTVVSIFPNCSAKHVTVVPFHPFALSKSRLSWTVEGSPSPRHPGVPTNLPFANHPTSPPSTRQPEHVSNVAWKRLPRPISLFRCLLHQLWCLLGAWQPTYLVKLIGEL